MGYVSHNTVKSLSNRNNQSDIDLTYIKFDRSITDNQTFLTIPMTFNNGANDQNVIIRHRKQIPSDTILTLMKS